MSSLDSQIGNFAPTVKRNALPVHLLLKVPQVTALFWVIKLLTTALGESTSDFLVHRVGPYLAVGLGAVGFLVAIVLQFAMPRFNPYVYWFAVIMVAVFGTMCADVVHIGFGVPYVVSSIAFAMALVAIFFVWNRMEGTLSIHSITTKRREFFYWATIITTFALGTAVGDMTAATFGWGYLISGVVFALLYAVPMIGGYGLRWNEVATFWLAYILTRPIGASFADWTGRMRTEGGIGIGTGLISIILAVIIVVLVSLTSGRSLQSGRQKVI